jgi:peroxiredoxin
VTGVVKAGSKVKPGAMLSIHRQDPARRDPNAPAVYHDLQAQADKDGRFTFERVPAGKASVAVQVKLSENSTGFTQQTPVEVKAGETVDVQVGGAGRPIRGRITAPKDMGVRIEWPAVRANFSTKVDVQRPKVPENWTEMNDAERLAWRLAYEKSPEGRAQQEAYAKARHFTMRVDADGQFQADDVPAGVYTANVHVMSPAEGNRPMGEPIAMATYEFSVSDIKDADLDAPLDVGVIELKAVRRLKVGDAAPDLAAKSLDGARDVKLADYRGRYVLAHFWSATWTAPSAAAADVAALKAIQAKYAKDDRLVTLGVVLDEEPAIAKRFVEKNQITWPQAFVGDYRKSEVPRAWGLQDLPAAFLIGPDGKVIAANLRGDAIGETLRTSLGDPK